MVLCSVAKLLYFLRNVVCSKNTTLLQMQSFLGEYKNQRESTEALKYCIIVIIYMSSYIISYSFSSSCLLRGSTIFCYDLTHCKSCLQMLIVTLIYPYAYERNKWHLFCRMTLLLCPAQESCVNQPSSLFRIACFFSACLIEGYNNHVAHLKLKRKQQNMKEVSKLSL